MTKNRHKVTMTVIYYSKANNGGEAHRELDELLLSKGYKIEEFEHNIE